MNLVPPLRVRSALATACLILLPGCVGLGITADGVAHPGSAFDDYAESYSTVNAARLPDGGLSTPLLSGYEVGVTGAGVVTLTFGEISGRSEATLDNGTVQALDVSASDVSFVTLLPVYASAGSDVSEKIFAPLVVWAGVAATRRQSVATVSQTPEGSTTRMLAFDGSEVMLRPMVSLSLRPASLLTLHADLGYDLSISNDAFVGSTGFLARTYTEGGGSVTSDPDAGVRVGLPGLHARAGVTVGIPCGC